MAMFNVNDEVIITKSNYPVLIGISGEIIEVVENGSEGITYLLKLEKNMNLHDGGEGKVEFGFGWYVLEGDIEIINKSKLCRMIKKEESIITRLKRDNECNHVDGTIYKVRKNGALTFLTQDSRKVFVYKDGADKPLILSCISEDDRIVTLHLMEAFRILPMHTVLANVLTKYDQKASDKLEAEMFPEQVVKQESLPPITLPTPEAKVYSSEEELYAELGITKQD